MSKTLQEIEQAIGLTRKQATPTSTGVTTTATANPTATVPTATSGSVKS